MSTPDLSGVRWRTSSYSGHNGECVEVAVLADGRVAVRDSVDRGGPVLFFTSGAWAGFLADLDGDRRRGRADAAA